MRAIDWQSADVHEACLTVQVTGKAPKGWIAHLEGVLSLLGPNDGRWGAITVHKSELVVSDVTEGAEDDLRHLLESALLQVNADLAPEDAAPAKVERDAASEADRRIGDAFRSLEDTKAR